MKPQHLFKCAECSKTVEVDAGTEPADNELCLPAYGEKHVYKRKYQIGGAFVKW